MWYLLMAAGGISLYWCLRVRSQYNEGAEYRAECEQQLSALLTQGYDTRDALIEISKARHPELSERVHGAIVDTYPELDSLVPFIYNVLEFKRSFRHVFGGKLTDKWVLALLGRSEASGIEQVEADSVDTPEQTREQAYALSGK